MALVSKRLLIPLAVVIALAIAAVVAAGWLIDRDALRNAVRAQILAATGLELAVDGGIDIAILPTASATLRNVALRTPAGGEPAMRAEALVAHLRIVPLLQQRFEIADVALHAPRASVTRQPDGVTNWTPIVETLAKTLKPGAKNAVTFSEVRIVDGVVAYRDVARNSTENIEDIDLSLAWPSISRSFAATGQLNWRNERIDGSISVADFASALAGEQSGIKVRLSSPAFKLAFDGSMTTNASKVDGTLTADSPNLRNALRLVGQTPPSNGGFGRFAMKARANLAGSTLLLSNVNVELDGNIGDGVMQVSYGERPLVLATLATEGLDLTPYASALRILASGSRDWNRQLFDLDLLGKYDVDMRLSAGKITIGTAKLGRTACGVSLRNGKLALSVGEAQALGGTVRGSLGLTKSEAAAAEVRAEFQLIDIDLEAAGSELFGVKRLSGRGTANVSLEGGGSSPFALAQTLDGNVRLVAQNGALQGFNIEQLLRRLERRPLSGAGDFRNGRTPFTDLVATLRINDGVATAEDIRMEGAATRMTLTGTASLPAREYDLKGVTSLVAAANAPPSFELPFVVQGPWDDPLVFPDTESLLRRSPASAPLLDSRKARDAVRSAIERLGGGQKPAPVDAAPQN